MTNTIYGLIDPTTSQIAYVSDTVLSLADRLANHLSDARVGKKPMRACREIKKRLDAGQTIRIIHIPFNSEDEAIRHYRKLGLDLWNECNAGAGRPPVIDWSEIDRHLGLAPDATIARLFHVSATSVWRRRHLLSIPPYTR